MYALIAFVDVYANYTTILAFKYTTITSVSLFDALAIPSAIIVSRIFFGRRYTLIHLLGVVVCSIGITLNVLQDYREDKQLEEMGTDEESAQEQLIQEDYPYKMRGDILAITGGILFGISNTLGEVAVKGSTLTEYLGCMTFFASIISFIQALILERDEIMPFFGREGSATCSEKNGLILFIAFAIGGMINYSGIGAFLRISDAAFLNLSLLTGDAWAVAFSVFEEGIVPPASFYIALIITVSGVFIYETAPSPVVEETVGDIQLTEIDNTEREEMKDQDEHMIT
jgi:solute carrier family 35 protein F1/2